ncbi:tRNA adenosine(34) deaminase TadA [Streptococcus ictaluri]|uniref:tRNA-specific adenosine deaminase n=1 Tax=Streptococcus ictaluri 707-05 TaxID=764299 RepID=G5JZI6_9STRE|nr:tRNA adenosine(34) deaminase TadA [Streptococcus ictaluri]EHI70692.1 cytidine and deoxycytidylate deaminase zinc-binding region [Streptococcus ictaluri 707-05]
MAYCQEEYHYFMREALKEAEKSLIKEEIPIGCVIVKDGKIIGRGHNAREELNQAIMHAEIMAINEANAHEGNWRLLDTTLFVTIEPCVMCSGAIGLARIPHVVYGASNQKFGGTDSLYQILTDSRLNHRVEVERGVLAEECAQIMQTFFRQGRDKKKEAKHLAKEEAKLDNELGKNEKTLTDPRC